MNQKIKWHDAGSQCELPVNSARCVTIEGIPIALFHLKSGLYATHDTCTHADASLAEGYLDGEEVECPLHQGRFHIPTGKALCRPVIVDVQTFPVRIENERICIGIEPASNLRDHEKGRGR